MAGMENKQEINVWNLAVENYRDVRAKQYLGIFGNPIGHTLSPVIHDTLSDALHLKERYIPFCVRESLGDYVRDAYDRGILGLNITVPHKQEVMKYLCEVDDAARAIGAVNTLVRTKQGYKGYNTDMPGLYRALASEGISPDGEDVIMLGAGGAARAVAYMCMKYGARRVIILNRTYERAREIAEDMNRVFQSAISAGRSGVIPVAAEDYHTVEKGSYLMIQCTSVGLREGDGLPLIEDEAFYDMAKAGVDLIYNPAQTPFLKLLKEKGIPCVNGLKMLLCQGVLAYEMWNDVKVSEALCNRVYMALRHAVYGERDNVVLIGYMGAGKTTIGKRIARDFGMRFLDTDAYIEKRENMSIKKIFESKGEAYFRELETEILRELSETLQNTVLSTGGGLPLREENASLLKTLGKVFFLRADADTIYGRVRYSTDRPLLNCENPKERIFSMLEERNPLYEKASHVQLDTDSCTEKEIISKIFENMS